MADPGVPQELVDEVSRICLALPETSLRTDRWAHAFEIRRRTFAFLLAPENPDGVPQPMLVFRAEAMERHALLAQGHPFFGTRSGNDRVGVVLNEATDWVEIAELVTESYRMLAPKKLIALLDDPTA